MVITSDVSRRSSGSMKSLNTYPSQFFDISSQYMPPSVKELFRWCLYLYTTHSEIAPVINKKCAYVITDLVYELDGKEQPDSSKVHEVWSELLERIINIREVEYKLLLDYEVYGNAFCSIVYPFERYLKCPHCKEEQLSRKVDWKYDNGEFRGVCKNCKGGTSFIPRDKPIRNRRKIRIIRWFPQYVDIQYNPFTDRSAYIYRIPTWLKKRLSDPKQNKDLVEDTPLSFLEAVKKKMNIKFDPENIYHLKNPSVSMEDDSFGMPPMLPIFKDAWLFQTYRRAQEAIAVDHILPMTLLVPAPAGGAVSPHMSTNLNDWAMRMQHLISRWRRDPNGIYTVPFAAQINNIRGDAKSLNVFDEMNQVRQQITGGLDVPQEFIYGQLNWSGSSISLRVLENVFLGRATQLNNFLRDFVVPNLRRFCNLPEITVRHASFKMADDAQQKQIALGLRQTNTISDQSTIEELGFDYTQEMHRRSKEEDERIAALAKQQIANAEIQGQMMIIQAEYQAKAQIAAQNAMRAATANAMQKAPNDPLNQAMVANQMSNSAGMSGPLNPDQQDQTAMQQGQPLPGPANPMGAPPMPQGGGGAKKASSSKSSSSSSKKEEKPEQSATQTPPALLDSIAHNFLKSTPPEMQATELAAMQKANPELARSILQRLKLIKHQVTKLKPLPENKPPRRKSSPV